MAQDNNDPFSRIITDLFTVGASLLKDGLDRPAPKATPNNVPPPEVAKFIDWALDEINGAKVTMQEATTAGEARWAGARMDALRDAIAYWQ